MLRSAATDIIRRKVNCAADYESATFTRSTNTCDQPRAMPKSVTSLAEAARRIVSPITNNDMLDLLTALWCKHSYLNSLLVEGSASTPCPASYASHFGSMDKAFRLIGFRNRENIAKNADLRKTILKELVEEVAKRGGTAKEAPWNQQVVINDELRVGIVVSRMKRDGPRIWQFGYRSQNKPDIILGARIAEPGGPAVDYFILPFMLMPHGSWITASESSGSRLDRYRTETLVPFYDLCARVEPDTPRW